MRWDEFGLLGCFCSDIKVFFLLVVLGLMWFGLFYDGLYVIEMLDLVKEWGWVSEGIGMDLEKFFSIMIEESDLRLLFGYFKMDEVFNYYN